MGEEMRIKVLVALVALLTGTPLADAASDQSESLATPESFASIADPAARSAAMFVELGKVLTNPRCVNCHPAGDHPRQGEQGRLHQPPVERGADGHGLPAMRCSICHQQANFDPAHVPGHPEWHLAPREMAWEGRSLGQICEQIKDRARNGDRDMPALLHHLGEDTLVGWAWTPGLGRTPAPGTQARFGEIMRAWADAGAACPAP